MMNLTPADEAKLKALHPDLVKVVRQCAAIYPGTFTIIETARSVAQQARNVAKGVSGTTHSRHVVANNKCRMACAADIAPIDGKVIPWKRWDRFADLNVWMMKAAKLVNVPIEWGGNWKSPRDGDHWQLPWAKYP